MVLLGQSDVAKALVQTIQRPLPLTSRVVFEKPVVHPLFLLGNDIQHIGDQITLGLMSFSEFSQFRLLWLDGQVTSFRFDIQILASLEAFSWCSWGTHELLRLLGFLWILKVKDGLQCILLRFKQLLLSYLVQQV